MGGDLKTAPAGKAPTFLVAALKDPYSGNLDRIQIIKGWLDKAGKPQEKIYDVVWGDADRAPDRRREADRRSGSTVDVANGHRGPTPSAIPSLIAVWTDPEFDPAAARVLLCPGARDPHAAMDGI